MSKRLPWFRMYVDFLDDPKMVSLAFEDQRHFIGVLALKSDGAIDQECAPEVLDRIVSQRLWIDYAIISDVKRRLIAANLIYDDWQPVAWAGRQKRSDHDPTGAERQRRYRENQRNERRNASRNGGITPPEERRGEEKEHTSDDECGTPNGEPLADQGLNGSNRENTPHQKIIDLYRAHCPDLPDVVKLTPARQQAIRARWRNELPTFEDWEQYFKVVQMSDFLSGRTQPSGGRSKPFRADLDFLIKQGNCVKVMEGKYDD